jgi:two-component system, NarL family, nitrate/nitrite response regulator NarL
MEPMMTLQDTVRVMIADDNFDMRLLVRATLGGDARLDVVAEAEDGTTALDAFRSTRPDVCVLDYRMPGLTGLEVGTQILEEDPGAKVLLFSAYLTPEITDAADLLGMRCLRKDLFMDLPIAVVELARS